MITLITTNNFELPEGFTYSNPIGTLGDVIVYNLGYNAEDDLGLFGLVSSEGIPTIPEGWALQSTIPTGYKINNESHTNKASIIRKIYSTEDEFKVINKGIADISNVDYVEYRAIVDAL